MVYVTKCLESKQLNVLTEVIFEKEKAVEALPNGGQGHHDGGMDRHDRVVIEGLGRLYYELDVMYYWSSFYYQSPSQTSQVFYLISQRLCSISSPLLVALTFARKEKGKAGKDVLLLEI